VRFSLGASRTAVVTQLLTEAFVLAFIGAALGLFIAGELRVYFDRLRETCRASKRFGSMRASCSMRWRVP